ncbi:hypothetical protein M413DRAFT_11437 [Hebeloma cylindrosporum]|uniref:Arrestin-like N-terminal domain-containing protein n=1 Tax=Hebeloma cylindrosporum TaxID=76867 RepID=A0A0C3CAB4_HEBCY|nr:hypothetical protein M413DRAFT_11437 [Hebeloma cylindrosporum h7]
MSTRNSEKELPSFSDNHVHRKDDNYHEDEDLEIYDHLPGYERESQRTPRKPIKTKDFLATLENRGKPWALLTLTADEPLSKNIPTFIEGSPVKGTVKLSMDRPEYIYSVYISIKGDYLIGNAYQAENFTFLDITHTLWSPAYGPPLNADDANHRSSTPFHTRKNSATLFNGPLKGEFSWPFAVNLPQTVVAPLHFGRREKGLFRLPHTFKDPGVRSTIVYTLTLTLKRHGILSVDDTLTTTFEYMPIIRPPPFPPLRQLAYQEGTPLLSPTADPDGWHSLPALEMKAKLLKSREVHVKCTVLDLLASPKAITVRVRRRIRDHVHTVNKVEYSGWRDSLDHSQRAVWWPVEGPEDSGRLRSLQGEIHLKPGMHPTTAIGAFRIEVCIPNFASLLFAFETAGVGFPNNQVVQEQRIEITTAFAPGPRPHSHTPAVYEPDTKLAPQSKEFSIGFY